MQVPSLITNCVVEIKSELEGSNWGKGTAYEMKNISDPGSETPAAVNRGRKFKNVMIGLHTVVIAGFTVAILVSVA